MSSMIFTLDQSDGSLMISKGPRVLQPNCICTKPFLPIVNGKVIALFIGSRLFFMTLLLHDASKFIQTIEWRDSPCLTTQWGRFVCCLSPDSFVENSGPSPSKESDQMLTRPVVGSVNFKVKPGRTNYLPLFF